MNDTACRPAPTTRGKWGRIISLAGAMVLCVSFFVKHVSGLPVPARILVSMHSLDGAVVLPPFLAAALLLPLMASELVPQIYAAMGARKLVSWAQITISLMVLITGLAALGYLFWAWTGGLGSVPRLLYSMPVVGFVVLVLAVVALVRSRLARKVAAAKFALWTYHVVFFSCIATVNDDVVAGLWMSLAACAALAIGSAIDWFQCRRAKETLR
jgi:hypothetical protein